MIAGARAALVVKLAASVVAAGAVVALGMAFWPTLKAGRVAAKSAVEQPVFVNMTPKASTAAPAQPAVVVAAKTAPAPAVMPAAVAPAIAAPAAVSPPISPEKAGLDQLAAALKGQTIKPQPASAPKANSEAEDCFARGLVALAKGDIAAARRWLEQAAQEGETRALMALGDAYNPAMLTRLGVIGAPGDATTARDYYNRAVDAGLPQARERLAALTPKSD